VVDDRDRSDLVRVGVLVGRLAVRRPPRVADAEHARRRLLDELLLERAQLAAAADDARHALVPDRDAGRVIAAILELAQAADDDRGGLARSDITDDAAHRSSLLAVAALVLVLVLVLVLGVV